MLTAALRPGEQELDSSDREEWIRLWRQGMLRYHLERAVVYEKRLLSRFETKDALSEHVLRAIDKRGMVALRHSPAELDKTIVQWLDHMTSARQLENEYGKQQPE